MTSTPSPSTKSQCSNAANLSKNKDVSSEDEEGDVDFNPFLKEAPSLEASSSLSSEIEELEADTVDSGENHSPVANVTNTPDESQVTENIKQCQETVTQESQKVIGDTSDDEDAIWRRTRARYSLVGSTLDELETFLQETDDEDDLHHNIDDEEEYRKFLTAALQENGNENLLHEDEEDEDNDADFELELEEALGSDIDENLFHNDLDHEKVVRRPETRQKKRQKTTDNQLTKLSNRPLRPILPNAMNYMVPPITSSSSSSSLNDYVNPFTPNQIGELHCLIYEHVQLLVQVFSLSVLEPSRQHISSEIQKMLLEILHKREQVSENVVSVIDVAPLNLIRTYMDDVSVAAKEHQRRKLEATYDSTVEKDCLFPFEGFNSSDESVRGGDDRSKKTIAAALVEKSKTQSIALVQKEIANLALRFFPIFNPALFPHKPPPVSVANRVLFTDAEDGLLARGLMRYNTDWKEIQKNFLPCKTPHQIFVRQKNRSCSRAPENPIKAVRRMKTSPLTPHEKALIEEGLKVYKLDWSGIWKYMVPHRDPTLIARQWRTAVGNQKSYKGDEITKAKRRLYESKRRKSKLQPSTAGQTREGWSTEEDVNNPLPPTFPRSKTLADKENCSVGGENNSGDEGDHNEEEAYVHEAFLADWRPGPSNNNNISSNVDSFTQDRLKNLNFHQHQHQHQHQHPHHTNILISSQHMGAPSRIVKLAPDLPPVNLPPTVRIMSQSAFTKYQDQAASLNKARENVENHVTNEPLEKGDSSLQMHPLLFQGNLPYYPLNPTTAEASSSSFDFFPNHCNINNNNNNNNSPQLNLNLFRNNLQVKQTVNFFNNSVKSNEFLSGVDFHPLLQRTDDGNEMGGKPSSRSPNELDLDIRLSSNGPTETLLNGNQENGLLVEEIGNDLDSGGGGGVGNNDEIVMEQEELSDSEEEEDEESVEFECEEMTDSEGEGGSDSDHAEENLQNQDAQDDCLPKVMLRGDESDEDEARCEETSKSDQLSNEERSSLGLSLNPKLPVTRNLRNSHANKSSTNTSPQVKKPRKRPQKLDPKV